MDALESKDLIVKNTRKNLLENDVVLVVPKDNSSITSINDLTTDKAKKISLEYAEEIFT